MSRRLLTLSEAISCRFPPACTLSSSALCFLVWVPLAGLTGGALAAGVAGHEVDPETTLETWSWRDESFSLALVQRLPDQTRAFFLARGLDAAAAEQVAGACVFQADIRNPAPADSGISIKVDLREWRVESEAVRKAPRIRKEWDRLWEQRGVGKAARIAFHWSLFPTEQEFLPGDYNWGMIAFGPRPGARLTLHLSWERGGSKRAGVLQDVHCAPDRSVDTKVIVP